MIELAKEYNNKEFLLQSNPWDPPVERELTWNLNQCHILSTEAALNFVQKEYYKAIQNRKKCIELATPFPAFEWEKIGDIYYEMGEVDSARLAYIKAVTINSAQDGAIEKIKKIYQLAGGELSKFEAYLKQEIQKELKASAEPAPDCELVDLLGNTNRLSQQRNKVVVLSFWDSWSKACLKEIPQLNLLVEDFKNNPDVLFWGISVEAKFSINKFIKETPFSYQLFHSGYNAKKLFKVVGFPTHFVIDQEGKIRYKHVGYTPNVRDIIKSEINSLLKEKQKIT